MTATHMTSGCPDPETIGMFNEGALSGPALEAFESHLATCDACVETAGIAAAFMRGKTASVSPSTGVRVAGTRRRRRPRLWLAAAAVVIAALGVGLWFNQSRPSSSAGVGLLIAAAPAQYRMIEPRLAGFRWAALRSTRGESDDPAYLKLTGVAGEVLERAQRDSSPETTHASGVADVLLRRPVRAVDELQKAAADSRDSRIWNDLAAAHFLAAVQMQRGSELPEALAAADKAIELTPRLAEAHFNRALILARMGLRDDAAEEWHKYLTLDGTSSWAQEARARLAALQTRTQSFRDALKSHDPVAMVRDFPGETRAWFETEELGLWGEAVLGGAAREADLRLAGARSVGSALRDQNGEPLLANAVASIESKTNRRALAAACAQYRQARLAYRAHQLESAEGGLASAASRFETAGNPLANVARFYLASVMFDENRRFDAQTLLEALASAVGTRSALRAQIQSKLGLTYGYEGRWSEALRALRSGADDFAAIHESVNEAYTRGVIADTYDLAGEREEAWTQRTVALDRLTERRAYDRVAAMLADAGRAEERNGNPAVALSLVRLEVAAAARTGQALNVADAYRRKALLAARTNDVEGGLADLREAGAAAKQLGADLSMRAEAECDAAEGVLLRENQPSRSVALLTRALDYFRGRGSDFSMPDVLLERARSLRASGKPDEARRDLAEAVQDVEAQQTHAAAAERDGVLEAASPLFEEAIDLLIGRGEIELAFAYAEQAHARALLHRVGGDATPATASAVCASLDPSDVLLEFVTLPHGLAIFRATRAGIRVFRAPIDIAQVRRSVADLRNRIRIQAPLAEIEQVASDVQKALISPALVGDAALLVIVGPPSMQSLPWAALFDSSRHEFLIERYAVAVAPSASIWLASRSRTSSHGNRLLLVEGSGSSELGDLPAVAEETDAVGRIYGEHSVLAGLSATPARVLGEASRYDVVHFAGHARATSETPDPALLIGDGGTELYASQIARATIRGPRLVVLAACATSWSESQRPDALPSLARAFLAAGVPEVVGTLWPVNDRDAAALFTELHRRIVTGERTPDALRHAQLALLRGSDAALREPIAWASAELVGGSP